MSSFSMFTFLSLSHSQTSALSFCLSSVVGVLQSCSVSKAFNFIPQLPFSSDAPSHSRIHTHRCTHTHTHACIHTKLLLFLLQQVVPVDKTRVWYLYEMVCIICVKEIRQNRSKNVCVCSTVHKFI